MRKMVVLLIIIALVATFAGCVISKKTMPSSTSFDERRVEDLQNIQHLVLGYWKDQGKLPKSPEEALKAALAKLYADPTSQPEALRPLPRDPQTGAIYIYRTTGERSFELCTNFDLATPGLDKLSTQPGIWAIDQMNNWNHGAGRVCFSRTIPEE